MFQDEQNVYAAPAFGVPAIQAEAWEREQFIRRTYMHLSAALAAFALIEFLIFQVVPLETLVRTSVWMMSGWNWLFVIGGFIGVSWLANSWANSATSLGTQYAGLSLYVIGESIIFVPILAFAYVQGVNSGTNIIGAAALTTLLTFAGLTGMVFITKADFSWLRGILAVAVLAMLALILCSIFFGFSLGVAVSVFGVAIAAGYILYDTSNVLHHYSTRQHVAAALALFASVALLFWYILQLMMQRD